MIPNSESPTYIIALRVITLAEIPRVLSYFWNAECKKYYEE